MRKLIRTVPVRQLLLAFVSAATIGLIFLLILFLYYASQIPDPSVIAARRVNESTKIYDRTGQVLLYDVHGQEKRTIVAWEDIPEHVKNATLALEDAEFYNHKGIDLKGIARALYKDLTSLSVSQGGSTVTQQLIKSSLLTPEKTLSRKLKEIALSIQVERRFSKDEILWMYLNQIPYGSNVYGVEAAGQLFFGKKTQDLTVAEAALLASLIQAPTYYSPYGNHFDELIGRRNYALSRMKGMGTISEEEYTAAIAEEHEFKPLRASITAPHFVLLVKEQLVQKYGEDMVENGGLKVITSLDADLQEIAEDVVTKYGATNAKNYKATNAALVAADPRTGQILAMVGSRDYFDIKNQGNFNVATANRQPGSSFKPFAYALLLDKGFTDSSILFDLPTEFNPYCDPSTGQTYDKYGQKCYHPHNYDNKVRGPVTLRQALAQSLNIPSVKVLHLAGIQDTIELARKMGITSLKDKNNYGLSLVLGGAEVRLVDLVSAYTVFANDGMKQPQTFVLKVVSGDGTVLEEYRPDEERVLDAQVARLITDILSDNAARSPTFGFGSSLYFPGRSVAAKTGTTQEGRDGWVVGYTPSLAVGVWTGNNDNTPMTRQGAGISAAGPMWHEFISLSLKGQPNEPFIQPDPAVAADPILNGGYVGPDGIHSILYYLRRDDPLLPNWEWPILQWASANQPQTSPGEELLSESGEGASVNPSVQSPIEEIGN